MMKKRDITGAETARKGGNPFTGKEPLTDERLVMIAKLERKIKTLRTKVVKLTISVLEDASADFRKNLEPLKKIITEENEHWTKHGRHQRTNTEMFFIERQAQICEGAIERFEREIKVLRRVAERLDKGRKLEWPREVWENYL